MKNTNSYLAFLLMFLLIGLPAMAQEAEEEAEPLQEEGEQDVEEEAVIEEAEEAVEEEAVEEEAIEEEAVAEEAVVEEAVIEEEVVMEEAAASPLAGFTAGLNIGFPVWTSTYLNDGGYTNGPVIGVIVGTPYGLVLGPFDIGIGAEISTFGFTAAEGYDDVGGLALLGTVNTLIYATPQGPLSAQIGGGYLGNSVGVTAGISFDYAVPNVPLLIRAYVRGNGTLSGGEEVLAESESIGWINAGALISYDISTLF